jgi:hypothetical protein
MRYNEAFCVTGPLLLLAAAGACAGQPAPPPHGRVEIRLTGADAAGTPQRLYGEFSFTRVDNGVVQSALSEAGSVTDALEVQLPAGRYVMTLNEAFVVDDSPPCRKKATPRSRVAWLLPGRPPLIGVAESQTTRVHFDLVSADPPRSLAGNTDGARAHASLCAAQNDT